MYCIREAQSIAHATALHNMPGAATPNEVTDGVTLKSAWLTASMLHQRKPLENRSCEWKRGWYAVHTGVSKDAPFEAWAEQHVRDSCDCDADVALVAADVNDGLVPKGFIAGLCHVSHCLPLESCAHSKWALGPVCMVIDQTLFLRTPVKHVGQLGTWPINDVARCAIQQQVGGCAIRFNPAVAAAFPPDQASLLHMREKRRVAKRKARGEVRGKGGEQSKLRFGSR